MDTLNPAQQAAVRYLDGPLLVLAGAGSGKTRVIVQKIAHLIRSAGYRPGQVAAVTFTNKAAREMRERVGQLLGKGEARGLRISTFHTLGLDILRREHASLGYRANPSIYDDKDSLALLQSLAEGEESGVVPAILWQISRWKSDLVLPDALPPLEDDPVLRAAARLYPRYQRQLKAYNAVDFDDLILQPLTLFQQDAAALTTWRSRIRYLLVDEYQDTNASQYQLVRVLMGDRGNLTVVGDDDQSIYAWRGARPENLADLAQDFPNLKVIKLEQNYRSSGYILAAANQLISNNPHVFPKTLWSELGPGERIRVLSCKDPDHEASRVVSTLLAHHFKHRNDYRDYAILYRGNHQSQPFERCLREHRIPYRISGGTSFFSHTEVKDLLAYCRLLVNPADDGAFLRIVNTPRREIGPATLEKLTAYAASRELPLLQASTELGLGHYLGERAAARLGRFAHWVEDFAGRLPVMQPGQVMPTLVVELGFNEWLKAASADSRIAERRQANVAELLDWFQRLGQDEVPLSFVERVNKLALFDILERQDEADGDGVALMTLHAAKGLEFPHVFLTGMEEDILPHRNSRSEEGIAEERRLAYVGITRAQRSLTLSLVGRRKRGGEWERCDPSRFLEELPAGELHWEGREPVAPEERLERGQAHLARLRSMLGNQNG